MQIAEITDKLAKQRNALHMLHTLLLQENVTAAVMRRELSKIRDNITDVIHDLMSSEETGR